MKKIYLYAFAAIMFLGVAGCNIELPYPIDEVRRGVVIDVSRVPGSDGLLGEDGVGDYRLRLTIPFQQGDFSMMSHAQLLAVLRDVTGATTSRVVVDNITDFRPVTVRVNGRDSLTREHSIDLTLDMLDVYSRFGKTNPTAGEVLNFTVNAVLHNGDVIPGWTQHSGINNRGRMLSWRFGVPERSFSPSVEFAVLCSIDPDIFTGTFEVVAGAQTYTAQLTRTSVMPTPMPTGVNPNYVVGIEISQMWSGAAAVGFLPAAVIWINLEDFSPITTLQNRTGTFHDGIEIVWRFNSISIDTCTREIRFNANRHVPGVGNFGAFDFVLTPAP